MSRKELKKWVIGLLLGALIGAASSAAVSATFEINAGIWPAAIVGAVFGFLFVLSGQNIGEGIVIAGILLAMWSMIIFAPTDKKISDEILLLLRELFTGFCFGTSVGVITSGIIKE